MDDEFPWQFEGPVKVHRFGRMQYTVVFVPKDLLEQLPLKEHPRLRVDGEVNGVPFNGALHPTRGRRYVLLSKKFLRQCGLSAGDVTEIRFRIADQEAVDVPAELRFALDVNDQAREVWDQITAGKRRSLAWTIASAKRRETREQRVEEVIATLIQWSRKGSKQQLKKRWY